MRISQPDKHHLEITNSKNSMTRDPVEFSGLEICWADLEFEEISRRYPERKGRTSGNGLGWLPKTPWRYQKETLLEQDNTVGRQNSGT